MSDLPIDYLAAGVLHALYDASTSNEFHSYTIVRLHEFCETSFNVKYDIKFTQASVERLLQIGAISQLEDPFADTLIRAKDADISKFFKGRRETGDIYWKTWDAELSWLKTAFDKSHFWQNLADTLNEEGGERFAPAADRIVTLDHNNPSLKDVKNAAAEFRGQLQGSNDFGNLSADQVMVAIGEVRQIEDQLSADTVRLSSIRERARGTLNWIAQEAAGTLVGAAALALLAAIAAFFGFAV